MRLELKLHPDCTCRAVERIEVEVARPAADALALRYIVTGNIGDIRLAPAAAPARTDELWTTTCFEAFVSDVGGYTEFNFAPSTQWAAYRFEGYRAGMQNAPASPAIQLSLLEARLDLRACAPLTPSAVRLALTAVIEEVNGAKSYWSLRHPPGKPDFHHADSFAYELNP